MIAKITKEYIIKIDGKKCDVNCSHYGRYENPPICILFYQPLKKKRCKQCIKSEIIKEG